MGSPPREITLTGSSICLTVLAFFSTGDSNPLPSPDMPNTARPLTLGQADKHPTFLPCAVSA